MVTPDWKERVRTRIRRSDGVIALVSKNSLTSSGQKWELSCAKEEKKKVLGIWAYTGLPTTMLYDRQGILRAKVIGFEYTDRFESALKPLL